MSRRTSNLDFILEILRRTKSRSISELYDKCSASEYQLIVEMGNDYHFLLKSALEIYIKNELECQRESLWAYAIHNARKYEPDSEQFEVFNYIFHTNGINPAEFARTLKTTLLKLEKKINAFRLIGCPDSGKSLLANCIVQPFITCYMNNHASENEFYLSNMLNKSIILCEELYITIATAEDFKSVLGGQPIDVSKKHHEKQLLSRTPVIITSNYERFGRGHLPPLDENALAIRCYTYRLNNPIRPSCTIHWAQLYLYLLAHIE